MVIGFLGKKASGGFTSPLFKIVNRRFRYLSAIFRAPFKFFLWKNHVTSLELYLTHLKEKEIKDMQCDFYRCMCLKMLIVDEVQAYEEGP
jgi:hypothetical protein